LDDLPRSVTSALFAATAPNVPDYWPASRNPQGQGETEYGSGVPEYKGGKPDERIKR
jgi:hypothetical protein